jgi:GMP synthase (glutamine-hydrolysing)
MRIHYFQHEPHEDLAGIGQWARSHNHTLSSTKFFAGDPFPDPRAMDWLIVLGGNMNVYETDQFPWLTPEKQFIERAIKLDKTILGICLGSQLLAEVLGASVSHNRCKEIGWFPVELTKESESSPHFARLPKKFPGFHWHGDTFDLPRGAVHIARSEACANQAFVYGNKLIGLQWHPESTAQSVRQMVESGMDELIPGPYVQSRDEILAAQQAIEPSLAVMHEILDQLAFSRDAKRQRSGARTPVSTFTSPETP